MGYTYSDANGYLDGGPSISGLKQIKKVLAMAQGSFSSLQDLLNHGYTISLAALAEDCMRLSKLTRNKDVKCSLEHLAKLTGKAEEMIVLLM